MADLYIPAFVGGQRHGGVRRSEQIRRLLGEGVELVPPPMDFRTILVKAFRGSPRILLARLAESRRHASRLRDRVQWALCAIHYGARFGESTTGAAWIEYSSSFSRYAPEIAKLMGREYVLLPQNIEFLVPGNFNRGEFGREFEREVTAISGARKCVCISNYDAAICETYNKQVETLPYFPTQDDSADFERIREKRRTSSKNGYLAIGSANNPPTRQGMIDLVHTMGSHGFAKSDLFVAGFGTETLRDSLGNQAEVLGSLSPEHLQRLVTTCKAVVIFQRQTSGFLTRLVEMNLCGVPIVLFGGYRQAERLEKYGIFTDIRTLRNENEFIEFEQFRAPDWDARS